MEMVMTVPCPVCHAHNGHNEGCERAGIERLNKLNTSLECPKCISGTVGVNELDFYECRVCRVQFSSSPVSDTEKPENSVLLDPKKGETIEVRVMQARGEGKFPIDEAITKLRKRIAEKLADDDQE